MLIVVCIHLQGFVQCWHVHLFVVCSCSCCTHVLVFDHLFLCTHHPLPPPQTTQDGWKIDKATFDLYLRAVQQGYRGENPYHNSIHAADVTQAVAVMLRAAQSQGWRFTLLEKFALLFAAVVHDLAHPGMLVWGCTHMLYTFVQKGAPVQTSFLSLSTNMHTHLDMPPLTHTFTHTPLHTPLYTPYYTPTGLTNEFLANTSHTTALMYNDRSINENYHVSCAFRLAHEQPFNIFQHFSKEEYKAVCIWFGGV